MGRFVGRRCVWRRWGAVLVGLACFVGLGCGKSPDPRLLEAAKSAVETGLQAWRRGDRPETLRSAAESIDFYDDDWQRGSRLVDFKIARTFFDLDEQPRCTVELTVQREDAGAQPLTVTYQVVKKPGFVIARDPFN